MLLGSYSNSIALYLASSKSSRPITSVYSQSVLRRLKKPRKPNIHYLYCPEMLSGNFTRGNSMLHMIRKARRRKQKC